MPALLTRTSIRPKASTTASTISRTCPRSVRSAGNPRRARARVVQFRRPLMDPIGGRTDRDGGSFPSQDLRRREPDPVGKPAPVTRATLSASSASIGPKSTAPLTGPLQPRLDRRKLNQDGAVGSARPFGRAGPPTTGVVASSTAGRRSRGRPGGGARDVRAATDYATTACRVVRSSCGSSSSTSGW